MLAKGCAPNRSGDWQVWKAPAQGGATIQVTHHGGVEAFESLDGMFVYYAKQESDGIWRVPVQGGEETQVLKLMKGKSLGSDGAGHLLRRSPMLDCHSCRDPDEDRDDA
jgi:hypothetical protein